jgi:Lrp/AsnC family leucine-responsive transcriptional regulator
MAKDLSALSIDTIDRSILRTLQFDGRITNTALAERVALSPAACHKRHRRLEAMGAIKQYVALINPKLSGRSQIAFVQITLERQDSEDLEAFEREVIAHPQIIECHLMTGNFDYLLHILVRDPEEYENIHRSVLTRLPSVARITSSFAIREVRRTTAIPIDP